ncbi:MAG: response regulator [Clostridiales bacterium]|nr:response regulator [Clostridiales bacterium]
MMSETRKTIFIVDDNMTNLDMGKRMLGIFYQVIPAPSAQKMFEALEKVLPDLILLDIEMPEMDGYQAIMKLKADPRYVDIPVIFLTARTDVDSELESFDLGAVDYVTKPFSAPLLIKRIAKELLIVDQRHEVMAAQAELKDYADNLAVMVKDKTAEVVELQTAILTTVADLVEFRDKLTGGHVTRTCRYLKAMADEMVKMGVYSEEVAEWDMEVFVSSAQLHDVGKIAISDLILNKPDKLTDEEFEIMKTHVTAGVDAIERIANHTERHSFLNHALRIAGTHHEKWDGTGYPIGLKGTGIPLEGRLMAIADVYDALISPRPYKKAFSHEEACEIIEGDAGRHFDPELVDVFRNIEWEFAQIAREIAD